MSPADNIRTLAKYDVEFIVVGGMSAVLQGAPVQTFDLDIVYARTGANIARLLAALQELGAVARDDPRRIAPNATHLWSAGHKLLETRHGALDVLGTIEEATTYDDLLRGVDDVMVAVGLVPKDPAERQAFDARLAQRRAEGPTGRGTRTRSRRTPILGSSCTSIRRANAASDKLSCVVWACARRSRSG